MSHQDEQESSVRRRGPLEGSVVAVTRPEGRAEELSRRFRSLGAEVVECPAIRLQDPPDLEPLRRAARRLADGAYDWLVFTSPAGVQQLSRFLETGDASSLRGREGPRVAAIGSSTAESARKAGFRVDVVPEDYRAEALAVAVVQSAAQGGSHGGQTMAGLRILLPRAAEARAVLPRELEAAGADVDEIPAYEAVRPEAGELAGLREAVERRRLDWLTFTASSIVRSFAEGVGPRTGGARVAAIGPVTAETARGLGLPVDAVAEEYTVEGLVEAVVRFEDAARRQEAG